MEYKLYLNETEAAAFELKEEDIIQVGNDTAKVVIVKPLDGDEMILDEDWYRGE